MIENRKCLSEQVKECNLSGTKTKKKNVVEGEERVVGRRRGLLMAKNVNAKEMSFWNEKCIRLKWKG